MELWNFTGFFGAEPLSMRDLLFHFYKKGMEPSIKNVTSHGTACQYRTEL